jgi:hypothetical protein
MKENRHSAAIPQTVLDAARAKITEAAEALADYTVALTPQERQTMLKMGDKTLAFVERANEYAHGSPKIVPSYLDLADFDTDFHDAHNLWGLLTALRQLAEAVEDTIMAAGGEAYHAALAVYHNVQAAAKDDIPGTKAIHEDLKSRLPRTGKKRGAADTAKGAGEG